MFRRVFWYPAFLIFFTLFFTLSTGAEAVSGQEITLKLSFGERTGIYTGSMGNGLPNGEGKFESQNEDGEGWYYEGNFINGHFQGQGTTIWKTGQKLEGTYVNDRMNGYGKYYLNGQLTQEGVFKEGELYSGKYLSDGEWYEVTDGKTGNTGGVISGLLFIVILGGLFGMLILIIILMFKFIHKIAVTYVTAKYPAQKPVRKVVTCESCGATSEIITGESVKCSFCGSPLN